MSEFTETEKKALKKALEIAFHGSIKELIHKSDILASIIRKCGIGEEDGQD